MSSDPETERRRVDLLLKWKKKFKKKIKQEINMCFQSECFTNTVQLLSDLTGLTRTPTISALVTTIQVSMSESFLYHTIIILVRNLSLWIYFSYTYEHIHLIHITSTNKFLQFQSSILFFQTNHRQCVDMTTDTEGRDSTADDVR